MMREKERERQKKSIWIPVEKQFKENLDEISILLYWYIFQMIKKYLLDQMLMYLTLNEFYVVVGRRLGSWSEGFLLFILTGWLYNSGRVPGVDSK